MTDARSKPQMSPEYRALARKYAWLLWVKDRRGLEPYEQKWLEEVSAQMEAAELAHSEEVRL